MVLLLLVSCRQDAIVPEEEDCYPVTFSLPQVEILTRATNSEPLTEGSTLLVAAYNPKNVLVGQSKYVVNGGMLELATDETALYLPAGTYYFCTIAPQQTLSDDGRKMTVAQEVDLLSSVTRAQMLPEPTSIELNDLEHRASQISFTVRVVMTNTPITEFKVKTITVDGMVLPAADNYLLPANEWVMPAAGETNRFGELVIDNTSNDKFDFQENAPDGKSGKFYNIQKEPLIVYPRPASTFQATITLDVKEGVDGTTEQKTVKATINKLAFEPGKRYQFEVNYGWDFVTFNVKVSTWTSVDNAQGSVGGGEQEIEHSFTVDEWGNLVDLGDNIG